MMYMDSLYELGSAVAAARKAKGLKQGSVAEQAGVSVASLSRFERGAGVEFGVRKLMQVLAVLGLTLDLKEVGTRGSLDDLRKERGAS